jgi:hypothetical protein
MIDWNDWVIAWHDTNTFGVVPADLPSLSQMEFSLRYGVIQYQFKAR